MRKPEISIILPCYNEGSTFERSVAKIISVLGKIEQNWEIIFVEDKSTDETKKTVEKLAREIENAQLRASSAKTAVKAEQGYARQARAIFHTKNEGRGKSVSDGIKAAKGIICGYLDVDLEVSASYIPLFVEEIEKGSDMVIGKRFYEGNFKSMIRFMASKFYSTLVKTILNIPIEDTEAGYKFFKSHKILPILSKVQDKHWFWDTEICTRAYWKGLKISQVPVLFVKRKDKKSTVKLIPDSWNYLIKLLKFKSEVPKTIYK